MCFPDRASAAGRNIGKPLLTWPLQRTRDHTVDSFVAMLVFNSELLPPLSRANNHACFILHSPQDFFPIKMAQEDARHLKENGAAVKFQSYQGGHSWRDDPYGKMQMGMEWLESQVKTSKGN